jgi:hypothetical protein
MTLYPMDDSSPRAPRRAGVQITLTCNHVLIDCQDVSGDEANAQPFLHRRSSEEREREDGHEHEPHVLSGSARGLLRSLRRRQRRQDEDRRARHYFQPARAKESS